MSRGPASGMFLAVSLAAACAHEPAAPKAAASAPGAAEKMPFAVLDTGLGRVTLRLLPEAAPKTVANFIALASGTTTWIDPVDGRPVRRPLYDGTVFFRVLPGFLIQGGSPLNGKFGGPGYEFGDEFSGGHLFSKPGLAAMANSGPNTNGSQFFITALPAPWLDYKHAVFGEVVAGLDVVEAVSKVPRKPADEDTPVEPVILKSVRVEYR